MAGSEYSIVLLGRYAGKDRAVAQSLSRCFGRDDAWGLQVVGATPIVLLAGLNIDQASAVADALADVEQAGSRLEIQQGLDDGLPKLQWPATPRIRGRLISEFGPPAASAVQTMMLVVPCPYTNNKIQLTLNMTFGRAADGSIIPNISATTAPYTPAGTGQIQVPIPAPRPATPAAPRPIIALPPPLPFPGPAPAASAPIPTPIPAPIPLPSPAASGAPTARLTPGSGTPQPAKQPPVVIEGLDALDELAPMDQIPTPPNIMVPASKASRQSGGVVRPQTPPQAALPAPQPIRPPGPPPPPPANIAKPLNVSFGVKPPAQSAPLPDVPVLHTAPKPPASNTPANDNVMPMPSSLNAPMDLSEFEATVTGSGIVKALQEEQQDAAEGDAGGAAADDGALYSVFIGKTNNPKAHQIVAEVLGVAPADAARLCQKPIVSLAKDISLASANEIKQRFAAANIQVRLNKKR